MSFTDDNTLHINIYKDNKDQIESSSNKSESYIIIANDELNNKVRNFINQISELTGLTKKQIN